ncbi:MAG: pyridoxamine 5'-phosphate oxidase family protein [Prochloraceae cyanobacterium]|nr:pyridoxamine 5'-phosphate oxidase family protein [Prochloraceae cyanobacterium]
MSLAPWRSPLSRALHLGRSQPHSRYLQLATVTKEGKPSNRTVVFRGFFPDTNQLQIVTDDRSEKIAHIESLPWGEICWYFTKTREQFRISGKITIVKESCRDPDLQKARQNVWQNLSEAAKVQFAWPAPGQPRTEDKEAFLSREVIAEEPPANFCLLLLDPELVDRLELKGEPQNRWRYLLDRQSQNWTIRSINP